ncbi:hypothetical protein GpartN1_g7745.t1 [Galdieria partita]|uniref:Uncharacterized protein n=1 Tax=Galdieria partita TaxID=83374 RepID=A0A9C7UU15_9RHOD|nr:hypothetical protein GpartN1_g7745.t1 [Galdieria partita]
MDVHWQTVFDKCIPRLKRVPCDREFLCSLFLTDGLHIRPNEVPFLETRVNAKEDEYVDDSIEFEDKDAAFLTEPSFPSIEIAIDSAIKELGGSVFPKLHKAPIDAAWISFNHDLSCSSADEVLTLLKCSERVTNYISELCDEEWNSTELELREWFHIHPGGEWRCFVKDGFLLAATLRDISCNVLLTEQDSFQVKQMLSTFFESHKEGLVGCWVIDVYIDEQQHIWVFDVESFSVKKTQDEENVWGLFSKEEVEEWFQLQHPPKVPVIRIVDGHENLFQNHKKWKSGMPWELRNFHATEVVQEAVSTTRREQDSLAR